MSQIVFFSQQNKISVIFKITIPYKNRSMKQTACICQFKIKVFTILAHFFAIGCKFIAVKDILYFSMN